METTTFTLKEVKALGRELLYSRTHINNLPLLLEYVSPEHPPSYVLESLLSLQAFFTPLLPSLSSSNHSHHHNHDHAHLIYSTWLRSKFLQLLSSLFHLLFSSQADDALREIVLDSIMEFVKLGNGGKFHSAIYHKLVLNIVHSESPPDSLLHLLVSRFFKYIDVRYFTYISLEKVTTSLEKKDIYDHKTENSGKDDNTLSRESFELFIRRIHFIISHIPAPEDIEGSDFELWSGSDESREHSEILNAEELPKSKNCTTDGLTGSKITKRLKFKFTKAWIAFLRLPLPLDVYKEVLANLHQAVIPHLLNPKILCDFLTNSYDVGGVVSVMALSSLFILMTKHGLEYPNFYEKLYALLLPSIFLAKHRAKFFQLLDSCLKSPLLPAYLAAAFAKKLSRLALAVPPSGSLVIIALIHNLLRRHPSINCLVHREDARETANSRSEGEGQESGNAEDIGTGMKQLLGPGIDHFDNEERNPLKSNALRSSLWEMDTLCHHYCPPVSRFVLSLENDLTVRCKTTEVAVEDFSSGSYATIFGNEMRRRVKQVPLAFYKATPTSLFSPESDFGGWTFNIEGSSQDKGGENGDTSIPDLQNAHFSSKRQRVDCCLIN